jgi:ATP-dependent DNA ligase
MRRAEPTLTAGDLDRAITAVSEATGAGSAARRKHILGDLLCRATDEEAGFMKRLLTGELRQGALAGLMVDAVAKAAGGPASTRPPGTDALRRSHAHGRGRSGPRPRRVFAASASSCSADPSDARLHGGERG